MPELTSRWIWECPNHTHCGAWAYLNTYSCGCVRVEWQDRGTYDPARCAHNPDEEYGPNYPDCENRDARVPTGDGSGHGGSSTGGVGASWSRAASVGASSSNGSESSVLDGMDGNPIVGVGALIGAIYGLVAGFQSGGLWGGFFGAIFGMFGGALLGLAITIAIGLFILYGVFWVLWKVVSFIWGLG